MILTRREDMSSFTAKPHGVDPKCWEDWKQAWLYLWAEEKKKDATTVKVKWSRRSEWDSNEKEVPWCPLHYKYCVIDESIKKLQDWSH